MMNATPPLEVEVGLTQAAHRADATRLAAVDAAHDHDFRVSRTVDGDVGWDEGVGHGLFLGVETGEDFGKCCPFQKRNGLCRQGPAD